MLAAFETAAVQFAPGDSNPLNRTLVRQTRFHRCVSALLLMTLCGIFVFPIPMVDIAGSSGQRGAVGKDTSVPFPCMHKSCGCRNAEDCWRGCCCFTNTQKLAWATQNAVDVPDYVVDAAKQEQQPDTLPAQNESVLSLLAAFLDPAVSGEAGDCCTKSSDSCAAIATADADCCNEPSAAAPADPEQFSLRLVSTIRALQCRGLTMTLAVMSTMLVTEGPRLQSQFAAPDYLHAPTSESLPDTTPGPPEPPPRLCGV